MNNRIGTTLNAGFAAIALLAAPAALAQGKGNGGGNGQGNADNGNRGGTEQAAQGRPDRSAGDNRSASPGGENGQMGNGNGNRAQDARGDNGSNGNRAEVRQTGNRDGNGNRGHRNDAIDIDLRSNGNSGKGNQTMRVRSRDGIDLDVGFALPQLRQALARDTQVINGCPPGLAKKRNGCLPPGQARQAYRSYNPSFFGLSGISGSRYFYDDGYLLSYRGDSLAGYLPLLGGALGIGNIWPTFYEPQPLPNYYSSYYGLNDPRGYRFAENVIYRVDPETTAIVSVAALLTGDDISIGQPLPRGYDVYNVPNAYRDRYADGPRSRYRYADGYIYEVDPETALVVAAIDLVT